MDGDQRDSLPFDRGRSVGNLGSERGVIARDDEHITATWTILTEPTKRCEMSSALCRRWLQSRQRRMMN